jgi:hypothetical protein
MTIPKYICFNHINPSILRRLNQAGPHLSQIRFMYYTELISIRDSRTRKKVIQNETIEKTIK